MKNLRSREIVTIAVMLFGMFFGAGNLIFPVHMGQLAGRELFGALAGFIITGVGLPLLGVAALGISRSDGLPELAGKVGRGYSLFFTAALYLTIGPLFAIPRCATTAFTVGVVPMLGGANEALVLSIFSLLFFAAVLFFSLYPGKILTWIGKVLTPAFLVFLGVLVVTALVRPMAEISEVAPDPSYESGSFFNGFLEGYNTMDALASLAFGIVVVNAIRSFGVDDPGAVAKNTVKAGVFSCLIMAVIYVAVAAVGAESRGVFAISENGGIALADVAGYYFGKVGAILLAVTVTLACLKTAVGLVTSCSETFSSLFPKGPVYKAWAVIFSASSFLIANLGLNAIIGYSIPVLMFLYPLAITLILLGLFGRFFDYDRGVFGFVTGFTLAAAIFDFLRALPEAISGSAAVSAVTGFAGKVLPFSDLGLGWLVPAAVGLLIGLLIRLFRKKDEKA